MQVIGFQQPGPIDGAGRLQTREVPVPAPGPGDVRVAVEAVSVNPVDAKLRAAVTPEDGFRVLGFDAAGRVEAVGEAVRDFAPGDAVYYAGDVRRPGTNAQYQCVDARLVAHKPRRLDFADAAAMPLTVLTAWECLDDHLGLTTANAGGKSLLVVGGAGGVGSVAIQIAAHHLGMSVIATAGRAESAAWCRRLGAETVVDYRDGLARAVRDQGPAQADAIVLAVEPDAYWPDVCELIAPFGGIAGIVDARGPLDLNPLKLKSASAHWEFMFARAMHDWYPERQGAILAEAARLIDEQVLESTRTEHLGAITAENLNEAHRRIESGQTLGKLVLGG